MNLGRDVYVCVFLGMYMCNVLHTGAHARGGQASTLDFIFINAHLFFFLDLEGDPSTMPLLKQPNPNYSLSICPYAHRLSVVLTPHQGMFSLQQMETITENHNQSKCRVVKAQS